MRFDRYIVTPRAAEGAEFVRRSGIRRGNRREMVFSSAFGHFMGNLRHNFVIEFSWSDISDLLKRSAFCTFTVLVQSEPSLMANVGQAIEVPKMIR